ncbi:hypothetical protein DMH04_37060 [Kibdelosporangium aridum]|uniref:Uncharacterized protein n=1 Tax=Kibdelosporangium aridum TaxID=2030 RepID=A0A428YYX5_KIBAR|nr:hypothetical protein [Kibdelosporangium aridum]RSM75923.1 hypothetical protein DMH04_37060 [Kibdelosporangium aridum]
MPHRNRVTPAGDLIATPYRGTMYGNRGVLHNDNLVIVRRHQVRRWLVCVLEFRGRQRKILQPRRYTELFFHDEAVALAAGHRPCAECRHRDYLAFRAAWTAGLGLPQPPSADSMDLVLHSERRLVDGVRMTHKALLEELPDGVFILWRNGYWLAHGRKLHRWTPAGYAEREDLVGGPVDVLTPLSTVVALQAGYRPIVALRPAGCAPSSSTPV